MSFRATSTLANAAKAGAATPKSADPWKYHLGDKSPFWKKFRETLVVNPESTTGNWITTKFRDPQPGSRPEKYALPPTKASDPAQNAYYERDYRRQYPRLDVITQTDLSALLLAQPEQLGLPLPNNAPAKAAAEGTTDITTIPSPAPSLSSLYLAPTSDKSEATTFYSASKLPPMPVASAKLSWAPSTEVPPHDEFAYFPMTNFSSSVQEQLATERGHDTARTGVTNKVGVDA